MLFNLQKTANVGPQVIYFHMDFLSFSCVGSTRQTRPQVWIRIYKSVMLYFQNPHKRGFYLSFAYYIQNYTPSFYVMLKHTHNPANPSSFTDKQNSGVLLTSCFCRIMLDWYIIYFHAHIHVVSLIWMQLPLRTPKSCPQS